MQVPLLLVLILLSIIPTLPACLYMLVAQYHMDSYQMALQLPQLAFLLASIGCGGRAVRPHLQCTDWNCNKVRLFAARPIKAWHGERSMQLSNVYKFHQRQHTTEGTTAKRLEQTMQWGSKPVINMGTAGVEQPGQSSQEAPGHLNVLRGRGNTVSGLGVPS